MAGNQSVIIEETEHDRFQLTLLISSRAASPLCLLRQARITRAPLLARSKAVAFPMPVLLPGGEKCDTQYVETISLREPLPPSRLHNPLNVILFLYIIVLCFFLPIFVQFCCPGF